jgi:hypothetical protein
MKRGRREEMERQRGKEAGKRHTETRDKKRQRERQWREWKGKMEPK